MSLFANMKRAIARTELMQVMLRRLGVSDWFAEHPARAALLRGAAIRCASCGHERECAAWLDDHATATEAPDFCRNADLVRRIKSAVEAPAA